MTTDTFCPDPTRFYSHLKLIASITLSCIRGRKVYTLACWTVPTWVLLGMVWAYTPWWFLLDVIFHFCPPMGTIIKTMVFYLSIRWVLLGPWFSDYPTCEYYYANGFPKSAAIATIPPMTSIQQLIVHKKLILFVILIFRTFHCLHR